MSPNKREKSSNFFGRLTFLKTLIAQKESYCDKNSFFDFMRKCKIIFENKEILFSELSRFLQLWLDLLIISHQAHMYDTWTLKFCQWTSITYFCKRFSLWPLREDFKLGSPLLQKGISIFKTTIVRVASFA